MLGVHWFGWVSILLPIGIAVIEVVRAVRRKPGDEKANLDWLAAIISLYVAIITGLIVTGGERTRDAVARVDQLLHDTHAVEFEVKDSPSVLELTRDIERWVEEGRQPENISLFREIRIPREGRNGQAGGDSLLLNSFQAHAFRLTYFVGYPWEVTGIKDSQDRAQQKQMESYLVNLLTDKELNSFSEIQLERLRIFHLPSRSSRELWAGTSGEGSTSGLAFLGGDWIGLQQSPTPNLSLLVRDEQVAEGFARDFSELHRVAVRHLQEQASAAPEHRCLCALFITDSVDNGLRPEKDLGSVRKRAESWLAELENSQGYAGGQIAESLRKVIRLLNQKQGEV